MQRLNPFKSSPQDPGMIMGMIQKLNPFRVFSQSKTDAAQSVSAADVVNCGKTPDHAGMLLESSAQVCDGEAASSSTDGECLDTQCSDNGPDMELLQPPFSPVPGKMPSPGPSSEMASDSETEFRKSLLPVRNNPPGERPPRAPQSSVSLPSESSMETTGPSRVGPVVSFGAPPEDQMSIAASEGERSSSGEDDPAALPPSGVAALPESDPEMAAFESGPAHAPVQNAHAETHFRMHPSPGLVCSDRPEGRVLSKSRFFLDTDRFFGLLSRVERISTKSYPSGWPCRPVSSQKSFP
ncbi:hypothetical protein PO909_024947 [Leuciscus waleckii]